MGLNLARVPLRCSGEVKDGLLKLVDQAVESGWTHAAVCRVLGVSDVRVHRWRARRSNLGTLTDLAPGGNPVHRILSWERRAVLDLVDEWGPTDRTHRIHDSRGYPSLLLRACHIETGIEERWRLNQRPKLGSACNWCRTRLTSQHRPLCPPARVRTSTHSPRKSTRKLRTPMTRKRTHWKRRRAKTASFVMQLLPLGYVAIVSAQDSRRLEGDGEYLVIGDSTIAVVVPAFNEEQHIRRTITTIPDFVDKVFVVDDASTDATCDAVTEINDPRTVLIRHEKNTGVGGAIIDGHKAVLAEGIDIAAVMAGDAQMPPEYLRSLVAPLVNNEADFTKGNRFFSATSTKGMPKVRAVGSIVLSYLMMVASGNWKIFDPQNGYTAIHRRALCRVQLDDLSLGYSFENSMLIHLNIVGARIRDVEIPAHYGTETSSMRLASAAPSILRELVKGFWTRIHHKHLSPVPTMVGILLSLGSVAMLLGIGMGVFAIWGSLGPRQASPGTVVLAVGGVLVGLPLIVGGIIMDYIDNTNG